MSRFCCKVCNVFHGLGKVFYPLIVVGIFEAFKRGKANVHVLTDFGEKSFGKSKGKPEKKQSYFSLVLLCFEPCVMRGFDVLMRAPEET